MLVNPYSPDKTIRNFPELENQINEYYDYVINEENFLLKEGSNFRAILDKKITFKNIFYYIAWLYDNKPEKVLDLGCGENLFKKWFPNIEGIDARNNFLLGNPDIKDYFDSNFTNRNLERYDAVIAIGVLHFSGTKHCLNMIEDALRLIKPNGRLFVTACYNVLLNVNKLADDQYDVVDQIFLDFLTSKNYKIIVLDLPHRRNEKIVNNSFSTINGDIRIIIEKK
jgi:hypothetical protein